MKAFVSWSGGKEASLSFYRAMQNNDVEISYLLNMIAENGEHSRTHGIDSRLLQLQADALGVPIIQQKTSWQTFRGYRLLLIFSSFFYFIPGIYCLLTEKPFNY